MTQPIQAVLIGAGQRAWTLMVLMPYSTRMNLILWLLPNPTPNAGRALLPNTIFLQNSQFESWEPLLDKPRFGQAALICTQDQMHTDPTLTALKAGYDVLLEKPMAPTLDECRLLVDTAEKSRTAAAHLPRPALHRTFPKDEGRDRLWRSWGRSSMSPTERMWPGGTWPTVLCAAIGATQALSAPMILAKCCHDLDILVWLLGDRPETLNSVGSLLHYRPENAPEGATKRCLDGCACCRRTAVIMPPSFISTAPP